MRVMRSFRNGEIVIVFLKIEVNGMISASLIRLLLMLMLEERGKPVWSFTNPASVGRTKGA